MTPAHTPRARWVALALALGAFAAPAPAADPPVELRHDALDEALRKQGEELVQMLRAKKYRNVGVLKFRVRVGDKPPTDNVGTLNHGLAERLTVALVLANPDEKLGVVRDASQAVVAAHNTKANHLTKEGRLAFFDSKYPLAWGKREVTPDVFVTGEAVVSPDWRTVTVQLQTFDKTGELNEKALPAFTAGVNHRILAETGASYVLSPKKHPRIFEGARGMLDDERNKPLVDAATSPTQVALNGQGGSLNTPAVAEKPAATPETVRSPVEVEIRYDGKPVTISDGKVPEPTAGTKVAFRLKNVSDRIQGVVLKVNGESVLFRERYDFRLCHKWILKPGDAVEVKGFQDDFNSFTEFAVRSPEVSAINEVRYGPHAGTFQILAVTGRDVKDEGGEPTGVATLVKDPEKNALASIARGSLRVDEAVPGTLRALQADLRGREGKPEGAKGLIEKGKSGGQQQLQKINFRPDSPIPTTVLTLRYYEGATK
jgi:hypothetical protein